MSLAKTASYGITAIFGLLAGAALVNIVPRDAVPCPALPPPVGAAPTPRPVVAPTEPKPREYDDSLCKSIANSAALVMKARQQGIDMSKVLEAAGSDSQGRALTIAAYKSPRFSTEHHQQRAIEDFRNDAFLGCVQ